MELSILHCKGLSIKFSIKRWFAISEDWFYLCKQYTPWQNTALCGILSGSSLFAKVPVYEHVEQKWLSGQPVFSGSIFSPVTGNCPAWLWHFLVILTTFWISSSEKIISRKICGWFTKSTEFWFTNLPALCGKVIFCSASSSCMNRGSYTSAHVFLNLLNELGKRDKMRGLLSILSFFRKEFNKFNNTRARTLDSFYYMTLRIFWNLISGVKTLYFCHYVRNVVMDLIAFPENL